MTSATPSTDSSDQAHAEIGLVCALPIELAPLVGRMSKVKSYSGGSFVFRGGFYGRIRVAIVESGPGTARAARATSALLDAHSPRWVISTGFCGALIPGMKVGQIVVSNQIATPQQEELSVDIGMVADPDRGLYVGRTLTVHEIVRQVSDKKMLAAQTQAIAVDMETHAVATVCHDRKIRFMAVRAVSDDLSEDLPAEVLSVMGDTGAVRFGAVVGALWKRPGSLKDLWRLRENAMVAGEHLADFLDGVIQQLAATST